MILYDMSSSPQYYTINIERNVYSYGFELKDEGKPYKKYVTVSKITNNTASDRGLKVGDKIAYINDEKVAGKDYIALRNNIRKSLDNCVKLCVLQEMDFQMVYPNIMSPEPTFSPMKLSFGRSLIPSGSAQEKISLFQNKPNNDNKKEACGLSNSCDYIHKCGSVLQRQNTSDRSNLNRITSVSVDNMMTQHDSLNAEIAINETISQDPFVDYSIHVPVDIIQIELPSGQNRVIESKSIEHIDTQISMHSFDTVSEIISEPCDDWSIKGPEIPKLEMPELASSFSIPSTYDQLLSPIDINTKSRSSNNIFEEANRWPNAPLENKSNMEFGSMTNLNPSNKTSFFGEKKLTRQISIVKHVPIRLRIVQYYDKLRSKSWRDYVMEKESDGAVFRKRGPENQKNDKTTNIIIKYDKVNKLEVDSPHRRHKTSGDDNFQDSLLKYTLTADNHQIQLRFHFNPSIFPSDESSKRAYSTYKEIINSFKAADSNKFSHSINISLSKSSSMNVHPFDSIKSITVAKELNSSVDEFNNADYHNSATNSYKSTSKSSAENISATTLDLNQSSTKSIFKQAIDKIRPEKKKVVAQSYQVFTGTKAEYEEFKMQLEGGNIPLELDNFDENGIHFNRYIYEVPRMTVVPKIPMIIYLCTEIVENIGLKVEGIYRKSGNRRIIRALSSTLNKSLEEIDTNMPEWNNVHAVCGTLKLFLRKLKQCLIPADLSHVLAYSCKAVDCDDPISLSRTLMDIRYHLSSYQISCRRRLDGNICDQIDCRWESLQYILKHLAKIVSFHEINNMDEHAISICFNPVLMESWQNNLIDIKADNEIMVKALELILVHQDWLFDNWHSDMDCSWSSELVENAQRYAKEFIDRKYDFNIKLDDYLNGYVETKEVDINVLVRKIVSQSTMKIGDKNRPKRRHSSHTPGERPVILRDAADGQESFVSRRNSQTTDALDLFTCASWMKQFAKVPTIDERKEIKMPYIFSTEPDSDVFEPINARERYIERRASLEGLEKRYAIVCSDNSKDSVSQSSQKSINSDYREWQRL